MQSTSLVAINVALLDALRNVIDLPRTVQSLNLSLEIDKLPQLEIRFFVDRDGAEGHDRFMAVTKRFALVEITEDELLEDVTAIGDKHRRYKPIVK